MSYERFMRRANELAIEKMAANGGPFGAVIVRDETIIAEGWNQVTSTSDPTAHAEVVAIREACRRLGTFRLADCEIVASCEPCPMCLAAIYWARLRAIVYGSSLADAAAAGFDDAAIYRELAMAPEARSIPASRLVTANAKAVFDAWARKPDRMRY